MVKYCFADIYSDSMLCDVAKTTGLMQQRHILNGGWDRLNLKN